MAVSRVTNPHCFSDPFNNEYAAYFIGFIMADGCIIHSKNNTRRECQIAINADDREILDSLNEYLGNVYTVKIRPPGRVGAYGRNPLARLTFSCRPIIEDLARFGVTPRKSLTAMFSGGIESSPHAWRGLIDGNGSVLFPSSARRKPRPFVRLIGSKSITTQFVDFVRGIAADYNGKPYKDTATETYRVCVAGRHAQSLVSALYRGSTVSLGRKRLVAEQILRWQPHWIKHRIN